MDPQVYDQLQQAFSVALVLGGPFLIVATIIGFVSAVFQTVTQIQDQTLPQVVKTITVCVMILLLGDALSSPLVTFSAGLFVMPPVK